MLLSQVGCIADKNNSVKYKCWYKIINHAIKLKILPSTELNSKARFNWVQNS